MRLLAMGALLGGGMLVAGVQAQSTAPAAGTSQAGAPAAERAAKAKPKPQGTSGTDFLTEGAPERTPARSELQSLERGGSAKVDAGEAAAPRPEPPKPVAPAIPGIPLVAAAAPIPVGQPTAAEVANLKVGTSEKDMRAALGNPAACTIIPDEGHLRKTCQYWTKGSLVGTVRLDNGSVVQIEAAH